jgi:DNA-binding MarR family transcriptional regulator
MTNGTPSRPEAIDLVATTLLHRASRLTRQLLRAGASELSRTEAGLLGSLLERPRRITELAESEALAQPTVTQLVDRLEARGLVARGRSQTDGRVVLVSISETGRLRLEETREQTRGLMRAAMAGLSDAELTGLAAASETLGRLIETLQQRAVAA